MNSSFLVNGSNDLQKGNTSATFEGKHFQFLWLLYVAYFIIFLASLFGNSVIIHIIRIDNTMKTTTNYLILNQACADLLITTMEGMNLIHNSMMDSLWFGGLLGLITCRFFFVIISASYVSSLWILVTIAVDRFYAVTRPLRSSPVSKHFKKIIFVMWALCLLSRFNFLVDGNLKQMNESYYCDLHGILQEWKIFSIITLPLNVLVPLLITAVLYTIVCFKLWSRKVPGEGSNQNEQQAGALKTARKFTLMMIVIVMLYIVCWFPFLILETLHYFDHIKLKGSFLSFIIWLTAAYSALNPYVYLIFSHNFRNGFKTVFINCPRNIKFCSWSILPFQTQSVELEQL